MPLSCSCDTMTLSAATRPADGTLRRRFGAVHRRQPASWAVLLVLLVCLTTHTLAAAAISPEAPVETLIIDHRSPTWDGERWLMLSKQQLERRRVQVRDKTETSEPSKTAATNSVTTTFTIAVGPPPTDSSSSSSSSDSSSNTTSSASTSTSVSASPLPSILDSLSNNFAKGPNGGPAPCPAFLNSFLNDPQFKQCYPLSMLFDSKSFFEAQKSLVSITRTLDATCAANPTTCSQYFSQLAQKLVADDNCGADYRAGLASVVNAYNEMTAYAPVYSAGCLKEPDTGAYCYANAVTNLTHPSATYVYFLPLNQSLPGSTAPACGFCLQQTMALYQAATADRRQLIANTYVAAAKQLNTICGPGFVNESLAAVAIPSVAAAALGKPAAWLATAAPLLAAALWLV